MRALQIRQTGEIKEIKKDIIKLAGFSNCMNGQLIDVTPNTKGLVMGFNENEALALLLGKVPEIKAGDKVYSRMEPFTIPVGEGFIGRIVNALAEPVDGKGAIGVSQLTSEPVGRFNRQTGKPANRQTEYYPVFREAPSVLKRVPIAEVFETGILSIDATIPIGKGQRELVIGDRMTGKTSICIDAIINQKGKEVICIYCCIGHMYSSLKRIVELLKEKKALDYSIVVSASASASCGEQYLSPYTACALGEYFMDRGRDVFVVFDDLTKHAWVYRQLSLLLERSPGRDAYPGDVFYLHSQLMERAGKLSPERGGGSMTFFPIVDTLQGDITGYIPSNLVSMTDGQIYLNTNLFSSGFKPAIDLSLSVSRIGNKVQSPAMKILSSGLRLEYIQYNELVKVTRLKANVSEEMARRLRHGEAVTRLFIQNKNEPFRETEELIFLYALRRSILDELSKEEIGYFKKEILKFALDEFPGVIGDLSDRGKEFSPEVEKKLDACLLAFFKNMDTEKVWE